MDELINRQAAINKFKSWLEVRSYGWGELNMLSAVINELENLPTVQPKHGKWLPDNRCGGGYWVCSSCKYPTEAFAADVLYKYCPFCGAMMERGEANGTD